MKIQTRFLPFIALAMFALLFALWAGLNRMGWQLPAFPNLSLAHGPLTVSGFLGVLIPLERAVAIRQRWMFVVPAMAGLGWMALLLVPFVGAILLTLASLGTLIILGLMARREHAPHTAMLFLGGLAWVAGNLLWLFGFPIFKIVYLWMAFLILTIGGERLELNRVLRPAPEQLRLFCGIAALLSIGALLCLYDLQWGARLSGLSMLALSLWFLKNDLATRNVNHTNPLTRYIAFCLVAGFLWLGLSGLLLAYFGALYAGPYYDAALHAVFVGFVISMIFGHAPIIFPAILGSPIRYSPTFYVPPVLLHLSLAIRLLGDLTQQFDVRRWGGLLNEVAILFFLAITIQSIVKARNNFSKQSSLS
jgi:hypothetical protein